MPKQVSLAKKDVINVSVYLDVSNPDSVVVLNEEEEKLLDKTKLPEDIFEFKSEWAAPNYILSTIVEMNAQSDKSVQGKIQRVFDPNLYPMSQIMVLLRSWNLEKLDPTYKLELEPSQDNPTVSLLSQPMMRKIGEIRPPEIISSMYMKFFLNQPNKESQVAKKLKEAIQS